MKNVGLTRNITTILPCRWGYDYNRTIVHNSIITEFNLICGKERLVDLAQISLMMGVLLGTSYVTLLSLERKILIII